jgi:hypothetical protein
MNAIANVVWMLIPIADVICGRRPRRGITIPVRVFCSQSQRTMPTETPSASTTRRASE